MSHRRRGPVVLAALGLVLLGLLGTSCALTDPSALTVGGNSLSRSSFMGQLDAIAADSGASQALFGAGSVAGAAPGTYSTGFTSSVLQLHVTADALATVVEREGLQVDEADRSAADQFLTTQLRLTGDLGGFSDVLVEIIAAQQVLDSEIGAQAVSEEALRELYEAMDADDRSVACASHILVLAGSGQGTPTEQQHQEALGEATGIAVELAGGADFAALATARSDDTGSASQGGSLGCRPRGSYVPEFDDAVWNLPIGTVSEPVRTQFGYHLIRVEDRRDRTFEEMAPELESQLGGLRQNAVQALVVEVLREQTVVVDGQFGRWDAEALQVVPPDGPAPASTPLASVLGSGAA